MNENEEYSTTNDTNESEPEISYAPSFESGAADAGEERGSEISYRPTYESSGTVSRSEITYTPNNAPESPKTDKKAKKKEPKPVKLSAVIAICAASVLLCGIISFVGAFAAGKLVDAMSSGHDKTLVIYKNTDSDKEYTPAMTDSDGNLNYVGVAEMIKNSVVEINTEYKTQSMWFQYVDGGAGSGVIISEDGYVITNAHVIMNEDETATADSVTVRLSDGSEYDATIKGYDTEADIAVLKIEAEGLTPAQCGDSNSLLVGEELLVVGNPLGELGGSVTNGIVSATEREIEVNGTKMTLIQTNAAVNPGNSGGGMFNMRGQLVGIVNAKSSGTDIEGLGFAIPINDALTVTEQLMEYGYVKGKVDIGVVFVEVTQNSSLYYYYNVKPGVYVDSLTKGLNDDVLKIGDRIIAIDGNEVSSNADIATIISGCSVGDTVKFQLYRDGKLVEATVTCYEKVPDSEKDVEFEENGDNERFSDRGNDRFSSGTDDYGDLFGSDPFGMFDFFFGR